MEEEVMSPLFWLQNGGADRRRLHRSYSLFLSPGALLIFLLMTALAFFFFIVPTLHSFTSHIFKPNSVKKSWDSLNLVLVLFAIFCGFLSRNNTNNNETPRSYEDQSFSHTPQEYTKPNPETPRSWYDQYPDRTPYYRLRSFNSYPDLRQESLWVTGDERWRFYDDTLVNGYRGLDLDAKEEEKEKEKGKEQGIKNIEVDTFETRSSVRRNTKKKYQQEAIEKQKISVLEAESLQLREKKNKRASATKELLTSLKGKKKKQRHKSVENLQSMLNSEPHTRPSQPPPSPPPPPPPPPSSSSGFHNLFSSKKNKHKKLNSASPPPPKHHVSPILVSKTKPVHRSMTTFKPKEEDFYTLEENVITGNESPLIPIPPPPPPPPPFKMPAWKFRVQGDFVRIDSISSSSSGSPDLDEVVDSVSPTSVASQGNSPSHQDDGESEIPLFYPSPDVDSKADNFIERFRAGLRMEKMNSTKEKQGIGRSNLRPSPKVETKKKLEQVKGTELVNATMS